MWKLKKGKWKLKVRHETFWNGTDCFFPQRAHRVVREEDDDEKEGENGTRKTGTMIKEQRKRSTRSIYIKLIWILNNKNKIAACFMIRRNIPQADMTRVAGPRERWIIRTRKILLLLLMLVPYSGQGPLNFLSRWVPNGPSQDPLFALGLIQSIPNEWKRLIAHFKALFKPDEISIMYFWPRSLWNEYEVHVWTKNLRWEI